MFLMPTSSAGLKILAYGTARFELDKKIAFSDARTGDTCNFTCV